MRSIAWWLFPELKRFDTADARWAAYSDAVRDLGPAGVGVFIAVYGVGSVLGLLLAYVFDSWSGSERWIYMSIGVPLLLVWYLTPLWFLRRRVSANIRVLLNQAGKPTCLRCGYNLTRNTTGRCPECGCATRPEKAG